MSDELGELLRSRRERLRPADVGLPEVGRRRTPGLRREEVAALASMSVAYYTVLEQGRAAPPSRQVLEALCAALRLDPAERDHLFALAEGRLEPTAAEALAPAVAALVDRLDPCPTYVTGRRYDVLAANRTARALFADWPPGTNLVEWMFTDPAPRRIYLEWEKEAAAQLARFRAAAARTADPGFAALVDRLHAAAPEVREWWPRHQVARLSSGTKRLWHPAVGELGLEHVVLQVADDPEQKVVTFADPEHGTARFVRLGVP